MGRRPKNKIDEINKTTTTQDSKQDNFSSIDDLNYYNLSNFTEAFAMKFANIYGKIMNQVASGNSQYLNPIWANNAMKRFNVETNRPTEQNIVKWLNDPIRHEKELSACSEFLFSAIQQYQRSAVHFASILNWDYELIPLNPPSVDSDEKTIDLYERQKTLNNEWLRKFRVKEQCETIALDIMRKGGGFYYLRESESGNTLQQMPDRYCYIDGKTDYGFTYAMSMTFFNQFPESMASFAPEFYQWYAEFLDKKSLLNEKANPYRRMPFNKAFVAKWDLSRPEIIPPLSGTFKDALDIAEYKDMMLLNCQLQTYKILYLKTPLDSNGKPTISGQEVLNYIALAQSLVNPQTSVLSTPMDMNSVDFKGSSSDMANIVSQGDKNFWNTSGVSGSLLGQDTTSAVAITNGLQEDYLYMKHLYNLFENFINLQLSMIDGKFNFAIRFLRRSNYTLKEDKTTDLTYAQQTGDISRLLSSYGYEPYQHKNKLTDAHISGLFDLVRPMQSPNTMSNKGGRPTAEESGDAVSDSNDATRSGGYNVNKT